MKIVIPGGTGQVGTILARAFHADGQEVVVVGRHPTKADWRTVQWDAANLGDWAGELEGADAVVNLAGRSVNCRYNTGNRQEILRSRVDSTRLVAKAIDAADRPPPVWLQMSTATIYAHRFDSPNDESSGIIGGQELDAPETWRFSIQVASAWEHEVDIAAVPGTRKVKLRSAVVMSPDRGGIFDTLLGLVRFGLGGTAGHGRQYVSWVHEADFVRAIYWLIDHEEIQGAVNIAAPNPVPNADFMRELRKAWGMPIGLPAPQWMLEIGAVFLRTESELVLKSRRVVPGVLTEGGFRFHFPHWPEAARDLCRRWRGGPDTPAA